MTAATLAVAANSGASTAAPPAARVRPRLRNQLAACLIALAVTGLVPEAHSAQPPGEAAAELAAGGRLDAALTLVDGWLAEHPDDARLFPAVLQVVTAAPEQRTVDAVLQRYGGFLAADNIGVLRAVPADWAELRGSVEQALDELRRSRVPDGDRRQAVLRLELGQIGGGQPPAEAPIAVHAGLARAGQGVRDAALEESLRTVFAAAGQADGGAEGAVAGYGLVALLSATGRSGEAVEVLAELGRRYPRSPEYALASAELRAGHAAGGAATPVVALPSPAMLLGSAALPCPDPCSIPAVAEVRRAPAGRSRQTPAAADTARAAPPAEPAGERSPDRVVLIPATAPAPDAGPRQHGGTPSPVPDRQASAPPAPAAPAAPAEVRSVGVRAEPAAAAQPAPLDRPAATRPPRARGDAAAPATVTAAAARHAARHASDRLPELPQDPARPAPDAGSRVSGQPALRTGAANGAAVRAVAAPGSPAGGTRGAPAAGGEHLIRVSAQPANRPLLSSDRVYVPPDPRAGAGARSQPARSTAAAAVSVAARTSADSAPAAPAASTSSSAVRVASLPDPAAFVVQVGAYHDPDNALEMELKLRQAGFNAIARSYRDSDGAIVHRVGVDGNVTRGKGEQMLARLQEAGFNAYISRRDVVSYLPPARRRR